MCQTSTLRMVPIEFWQYLDLFKRTQHFFSSKIIEIRAFFFQISQNFSRNLLETKILKCFWFQYEFFLYHPFLQFWALFTRTFSSWQTISKRYTGLCQHLTYFHGKPLYLAEFLVKQFRLSSFGHISVQVTLEALYKL